MLQKTTPEFCVCWQLQLKPTTVPSCSFQSSTAWCTHLAIFASSSTFFPFQGGHFVIIPQTGLPVWGSCSFQRVASLGRMILPVSGLASHSGCLGPHEFTPVFHLSFTLVCHSGCLGPHEFTVYTCLPHSSPTLVFHTCLPLWGPWAA